MESRFQRWSTYHYRNKSKIEWLVLLPVAAAAIYGIWNMPWYYTVGIIALGAVFVGGWLVWAITDFRFLRMQSPECISCHREHHDKQQLLCETCRSN
jgi:hypothetical protein